MTDVTPWPRTDEARALWRHILATPYDTIRRRLEMGERAEKAAPAGSMTTPTLGYRERDGWDACLDYIRGDQ